VRNTRRKGLGENFGEGGTFREEGELEKEYQTSSQGLDKKRVNIEKGSVVRNQGERRTSYTAKPSKHSLW